MFQFTRFASQPSVFRLRYPCGWVSPFRDLRITAYLPAPRSFSQAITSFVAYHRQGIHHMLLVTWPYNFDFSYKKQNQSRTVLSGLSPDALCRNVNVLFAISLAQYRSWERFVITWIQTKFKFVLTQSKLSSEARLRLRAFPLTTLISTLWIVKEQPIDFHKKSTTKKPLAKLLWCWSRLNGGGWRDRTDDPLLAKQVLSQLS